MLRNFSATSFFLQSEESTVTQPIVVRTAVSVQKKAEKSAEMTKKDKIKALKKELDKAISEQNFEHAAELRSD